MGGEGEGRGGEGEGRGGEGRGEGRGEEEGRGGGKVRGKGRGGEGRVGTVSILRIVFLTLEAPLSDSTAVLFQRLFARGVES